MAALIGRLLQLGGMILLPVGLMYGLALDDIRTEVRLLAAGGIAFLLGWLISRDRRA